MGFFFFFSLCETFKFSLSRSIFSSFCPQYGIGFLISSYVVCLLMPDCFPNILCQESS